jgi:hypothetical protein
MDAVTKLSLKSADHSRLKTIINTHRGRDLYVGVLRFTNLRYHAEDDHILGLDELSHHRRQT